jgi:flagellar hook-associated protein 3 FlgL
LQQAVDSANGTYAGRYVLSGFQTNKAPFVLSTSGGATTVTYQGDNGAMQREIAPGQTVQVNVPGSTALPAVFTALIQIQNDLQNGNVAALGGADLQALDQAHDGLLLAQTTVGASMNRVQAQQQTVQTTQAALQGQISQLVDANMAQAAVTFSTSQATYQAALSAAAKVLQPSLLEFLK